MKKILLISLFLLSFLFAFAQFENTVITVSDAAVEEGDVFEIEVSTTEILDEWDVISFQFVLSYDPAVLQFNSMALGEVPNPSMLISNEDEPGTIIAAYANAYGNSGAGTLAIAEFTAIAEGETVLDIEDFKYNTTFLEAGNLIDGNALVTIPNPFSDVVISAESMDAGMEEAFSLGIFTTELTSEMGAISFQFDLEYDTSMMTFTGSFGLGDVPNPGNLIANESEPGLISVAYANVMPVTGAGELCNLEFQSAGIEGPTTVSFAEFKYNSTYLLNLESGIVNFIGGPQEIDISKNFVSGWNWFSVNVIGEDMSANGVLASIGMNGANIKSQTQSAIYYPGPGWLGSLTSIGNETFYKIDVNSPVTWEYTGTPLDLAETTYNLTSGWNWISYAPQSAQNINTALGEVTQGTNIKSQTQSAIFYPGPGWLGSLTSLSPLSGYMLQMNAPEDFNYPEPAVRIASKEIENQLISEKETNMINRDAPGWAVNPPDFEYTGSIWGVVEVDGAEVDDVNDLIGVFVGDECRGLAQQSDNSVQYMEYFDRTFFMPMAYSNVTGGETLTFKYYDASEDAVYDVVNSLDFVADMFEGNGFDPFVFEVSTIAPPEPHFATVWSGTPYFPHTVTVLGASINGSAVEAGDEIAVFDVETGGTEVCVGVTIVEGAAPYAITASMDTDFNATTLDGFYPGHEIMYKIWDASAGVELTDISAIPAAGAYAFNGSNTVMLDAAAGNIPPIADAGEDQTVLEGDTVQLDGTASYDPDGETRTAPDWSVDFTSFEYSCTTWAVIELDGTEVTATDGLLGCFVGDECRGVAQQGDGSITYFEYFGRTYFMPMIYSNVTGGETVTFKYYDPVSDDVYDVDETLDFVNNATYGDGFNPEVFTVTTIDIPDLEFMWMAPAGITLSDETSAIPTFVAPEVEETTNYEFTLLVSDGTDWSEPDLVTITVENSNLPPVADAGEDQIVMEGDQVQLDGTASYDPDDIEEREIPGWTINPPDFEYTGSIWGVVVADGVQVTDTDDLIGVFVGDECRGLAQQSDNSVQYMEYFDQTFFMPMAYSNVTGGETLTFKYYDASADEVYDVEETLAFTADMFVGNGFDPFVFTVTTIIIPDLEFSWTAPEGIILSDPTYALPTFIAPDVDIDTEYTFGLVVSDGEAWSEPDEVVITVQNSNSAPVIMLPETFEFAEDTIYNVDFSDYVSDPDENELTLTVEGNEAIEVTIEGLMVEFSSFEANWNGSEVMTFTVNDNEARLTASDDVTVIITPENDTPTIMLPDFAEIDEDTSWEFDLTPYVYDIDGDELQVSNLSIFSSASGWEFNYDGLMVYITPPLNFFNNVEIEITITDNAGRETAADMMWLNVLPVNDAPTIELPEEIVFDEDTIWEEDFSMYVNDVDNEDLYLSVSGNMEIAVDITGLNVVFSAAENWFGNEELIFTVSDNYERLVAEDMVNVIVTSINDNPIANAGEIYTGQANALNVAEIELNGSESYDIDGEIVSWEWTWEGGSASGEVVTAEFPIGQTEVTLNIMDNEGGTDSDIATVIVADYINIPPVAVADEFMGYEDDFIAFDVLYNDYDPDNVPEPLSVEVVDGVTNGELVWQYDGFFEYTPSENWFGIDTFTYKAFDGMDYSEIVMVTLTIESVNDEPVAFAGGPYEGQADQEENATILLDGSESFDIDGEIVSWEWTWEGGSASGETAEVVFTTGSYEVELTVTDNEGGFDMDTAEVTVFGYINEIPVAEADSYMGYEDTELYGNVLENDYDPDEYPEVMIAELVSPAMNGELVLQPNGDFEYIPNENWFGMDSFEYKVFDGMDYSEIVMVELTVEAVNDTPEQVEEIEDIYLMEDFGPYQFDLSDKFTDIDDDELIYNVAFAAEELLVINLGEGLFEINSIMNWFGESVLLVSVTDGEYTLETEVTVFVDPVNDDPEIDLPETLTMDEAVTFEADFTDYINDIDEDELELTVEGNVYIDVMINGFIVTFDAPLWYGEEVMTFTVNDNMGRAIASDDVTVIVRPALFEAMIDVSSVNVLEDQIFTISVSTSELYEYWNVISFEFDLHFDAEMMEYTGYNAGGVLNPNAMLLANNSNDGVIAVAYADAMPITGEGDLITFEFMAANAGTCDVTAVDFKYNATDILNIDQGSVFITDVNHAPVADAGADQSEYELEEIMLDASGSYDPDGQAITYLWEAPEGIVLDDPASITPMFTAPEVIEDTEYVITLTVSDGDMQDMDEVIITVLNFNHAPVAEAGEDQFVNEGEIVYLDGSLSFDIDNDDLTFMWEAPEGIFLENPEIATPMFVAPAVNEDTVFELMLTVSDGEYEATDNVMITVFNAEIPEIVADISVTSGEGEPGEPIPIQVVTTYIDPAWNVFSFEFFLAFNEMELSLDGWSIDNTILIPDGILEVTPQRGVVKFKFTSLQSSGGREFVPIEGEGNLINLEFSSITGGQAQFEIYDFVYNTEDIEVVLPGVINNNPPVALQIPDQELLEDFEPVMINLSEYITDPDGDELTFTADAEAGVNIEISGADLEIASVENFYGDVELTITAWDGYSDLSMVEVEFSINVLPVNDAPVIELPESFAFDEDAELMVDFAPYISDIEGDELTISVSGNENIFVEIDDEEVMLYAEPNFYGMETLTFTVDDGNSRAMASDDVIVNVISINDAPYAEAGMPINATAGPDGMGSVMLNGSASYDIDGEIVEYMWVTGENEVFGENAEMVLAVGNYIINLTVTDDGGLTDSDIVQVSIAPYTGTNPIAYPDFYDVDEDVVLTVTAENGILFNDTDDGYPNALTAFMIDEPEIGDIEYEEMYWDGSFEFTPPEDWFGEVQFSYVAFDGNIFSEVTYVTITVNSVNDLPVVDAGGPYMEESGVNGTALVTLEGEAEDSDGDIVSYEWYYDEVMIGSEMVIDYEFMAGTHEVLLVVTDNEGGIGEDTAEVIIGGYENIAPVAMNDYYSVNEDEILAVPAENGLLVNDYDEDEYPQAISCVVEEMREFVLNVDGSFVFTPEPNFYGTVNFEYTVTDGDLVSEPAMIVIEVMPVNDIPVIELPDSYSFEEDGMLIEDFSGFVSDIDSEMLALTVSGNEMIYVMIEGFSVTFTAAENWNGSETITFTVSDDAGRATASDDVVVEVVPVNDAPLIEAYMPEEMDITIYDDSVIEFYIDAVDVDSDLEYSWILNDEVMGIYGNIFTPEFIAEGDYEVTVIATDGELSAEVTWMVHYLHAPDWQPVMYDDYTTAYGYVTVDGLSADAGDMIGAFVDGECRGYGVVDEDSRVTFDIYGEMVEIVNFKFWDYETDAIMDLEYFTQTYPGGAIGSMANPLPFAVETGYGPGWVPVVYTNSTIMYSIVTIEEEAAEAGDVIAAFIGEECRAVTEVQFIEESAVATLVIQGEEVETAHFRIWDASEDMVYNCPTVITTNPGGVIGYPPNEIALDFTNLLDQTQLLSFNFGWNLISLYVRPIDMSVGSVFEPIMDQLHKVKDIYSSYDPNLPSVYNTLQELEDGGAYYVRVTEGCDLEVTGTVLDPAQTPIELNFGWNLVGYVNSQPMNVELAFAELIENETLHKVKDIHSSFDPNLPSAYNTLDELMPGKGYYVRTTASSTFYYPEAVRSINAVADMFEDSIWETTAYTNSMVAYINLDYQGSEGMILGAFAGDECRGISRIHEYNGVNISSIVINSEVSEEISFKLYDTVSGNEIDLSEHVCTKPGTDYPGLLTLTPYGEDEVPAHTYMTGIYPNPFNPETTISYQMNEGSNVKINVYNSKGQLVKTLVDQYEEAGTYNVSWHGNNASGNECSSGMYFVRFESGSSRQVEKVVLMK